MGAFHEGIPLALAGRAFSRHVPLRIKLAGIGVFAVSVTLATILIPMYRQQRAEVVALHAQRLAGIAKSTAVLIAPESLDVIDGIDGQNSGAYGLVRGELHLLSLASGGAESALLNGLAVVRRDSDGYHMLANARWNFTPAGYRASWVPPDELIDSLNAGRAAVTGLLRDDSYDPFMLAIAPIHRSAGSVAGFVLAEWRATALDASLRSQRLRMFAYTALAFALAVLIAFFPARRLAAGVDRVSRHATAVAGGSLAGELDFRSNDELGRLADAVRTMTASLRTLLREVDAGAAEVAATAEELAADASQMTGTTEQVATAANEIAEATANQTRVISAMLDGAQRGTGRARETAAHAKDALGTAQRVAESALSGTGAADAALQRMAAITDVTEATVPVVNELAEKSRRIGQITGTIEGIARQTNLLALNAAIEAARAGEHGRGFAVVAEEVRKLATETQNALETIQLLVAEIQVAANRAGGQVAQVRERVADGEVVIRSSASALRQIGEEIAASRDAVARIADASASQLSEAEALSSEAEQIAASAEENAATSQEVSAAAEQQSASMQHVSESSQHLAEVAARLRGLLARFDLS